MVKNKLVIEVTACMIVTQIKHLIEDINEKLDKLKKLMDSLQMTAP